ncbi:MAG: membrane protein insertion efficiency factor YidD [Thermodesulfobacteria bacterium]|nr:membrane protein insertion efficiency factor YidD [Thermodesulfobacteriota bacterium]
MKKIALTLIRLYKILISPLFPSCCRFHPSCSTYASEAIGRFGLARGTLLALWRLLRCHPLCAGGYDPVPHTFPWSWRGIKKKGVSSWKETSY